MAIVPKRTLEDIRFNSEIADVVGSYITLKRAGSNFKALCPFHKEKTPSFTVNTQRQIFHCFGCSAGGDVFTFVMMQEGVDFMMAVKMLAERAGIKVEFEDGDGDSGDDKARLYEIHREIAEFYQRCLEQMKGAESARRYLESRELGSDLVEIFQIGYAPNRWDAVVQWGEKKGIPPEVLEQAGLIQANTRPDARNSHYDRFRNRLMFPIHDEQSRVIGFSGRVLEGDSQMAKYVNSPETPLFKKSRILYALHKARRPIAETRECIVCEGQIDVIRCHHAGFDTAVAAQGTAFTEDHARILKRYADGVVLMFDPDTAGQDAAIRAAVVFMAAGLAVRVATLPEGQDPDTYIRERGAEAFKSILDRAESTIAYQVRVLSSREDAGSEVGVMRICKAVLESIQQSPNAVQRAKLVQEAAQLLNLPASALQDDLRAMRSRRRAYAREEVSATSTPAAQSTRPREEVELCEHLVHAMDDPDVVDLLTRYLPFNMITDQDCRRVAEACIEACETGQTLQEVLSGTEGQASTEVQQLSAAVLSAPSKIRGGEVSRSDAVRDLILRLWQGHLKRERSSLEAQLGEELNQELIARKSQITLDLDMLKTWQHGSEVIEMEMAE